MIKLIRTYGPGSDSCNGYDVEMDKPYTVGAFVKEVLEKFPKEWGDFSVIHEVNGSLSLFFRVDYGYGKLRGELPEDIARLSVVEVKSNGGWSAMSYSIKARK